MASPVVMLVDNGSRQATAVRNLRRIAEELGRACGLRLHPVSLQHVDRIPASELDGRAADAFVPFLRARLGRGEREFVVLPLFFGNSRAVTSFIPEQVGILADTFGSFSLRVADVLVPMPAGEPLLVDILADHVARCSTRLGHDPDRVIVVDHGSPIPEVTAVRAKVAMALRERLPPRVALSQAVMERRQGAAYDFNGELLGDLLDSCLGPDGRATVVLAMMFISPGRHAGPGGDIEGICNEAMTRNPGLRVEVSPLVGEHLLLIEILRRRLEAVL